MTFTKENIENLKLVCKQIISLTNESVDGSLMHSQMMCLGDRIKDFGKNPIVKNSGILLLNESPIADIDVQFSKISKDDVLRVVKTLNMKTPSDDIIQEIINEYPGEQEQDPSANWSLIVETQLYAKLSDKTPDAE